MVVVFFFLLISIVSCCDNPVPQAWVPDGYCATVWASGLSRPRGMLVVSNGDILVISSTSSQVTVLWETAGQVMRSTLASAQGINHGIAFDGSFLYASSSTTVYRWRYEVGQRNNLGTAQVVVNGIPSGGHSTRTLEIDNNGLLYVSCGSAGNVDQTSIRSRIRRFDVSNIPGGGISWNSGYVFADGLRNEVGITFDSQNRLWGVENGCDNLQRSDLGGDIHDDNPSEEVNLFDEPGSFYGYPFCWSEYDLPTFGQGPGTQWVHPNFMNDGVHTDAWCRNTNNVVAPSYNMGAHIAPLDMKFYYGNSLPGFPSGGAFVAAHGSWNRSPPQGYKVLYLTFQSGLPTGERDIFRHSGSSENWNIRPVSIGFKPCATGQCLYLTSDTSGQIIEISYEGTKVQ